MRVLKKKTKKISKIKFIFIFIFFIFALRAEENFSDDDFDIDYNPDSFQENTVKVWDPFEKYNRVIFSFNVWILKNIISPIYNNFYVKITTDDIRKSISNFHTNLTLPMIFLNHILQLNFTESIKSLYSFLLNSTIGIFGFYNPAGYQETIPEKTNLSITLAKYYIPSGPYIILPFWGPSDLRGIFSDSTEILFNPINYNLLRIGGKKYLIFESKYISYTRTSLSVLYFSDIAVKSYNELLSNSFDSYALTKSGYEQMQSYKINKVRSKK